MRRSILFLITGLFQGGAEVQVSLVARELAARGWNVHVVTMISGGPLQAELENAGIRVTSLGMRRRRADQRGIVRMIRILCTERPVVLHCHMVHANLLGRFASIFAKVPVLISTSHSINEGGRWRDLGYRITDPLADLTTSVCDAAAKRFIAAGAVPPHKLRVVGNGVPIDMFKSDEARRLRERGHLGAANTFVWLAVGRFDAPKDYSNLLNAFALIPGERILLIAGDGPLRDTMEQLATKLCISRSVRFLGIRKDIPKLMAAADAYVMSSAWEGLPMVLLEAAASGLPIVATDVGGNREIVQDGLGGFLVPPGDTAALAGALKRTEQIPSESLRRMGVVGREHVTKHYSLDRVVDQWEAIYESFLR